MATATAPSPDLKRPRPSTWRAWASAAIIALATALAYSNSFHGPFILDDTVSIAQNPHIRSLWPIWLAFAAPRGVNTGGRPVANFTFALNYAVSGQDVWSYHAANLLIHILAALTLFGVVRRAAPFVQSRGHVPADWTAPALAVALLWAVHPLQTESVTYIVQRCESLMGLMFLLTFYCALRGWASPSPTRWHLTAAGACLVGVGCKEVIVAAPAVVLLFDWMFVHRPFPAALRGSPTLYGGFLASLLALAALVAAGATVASGPWAGGFTPLEYAWTQGCVVLHYLRLAVWPDALCFDCGWRIATLRQALPSVAVVLALLAVTAVGVWRRHPLAFPAAWAFVILAPTSSLNPIVDIAFEHRMYLPLAGVIALVVFGSRALAARLLRVRARPTSPESGRAAAGITAVLALVLGGLTYARNADYRTAVSIWADTVRKSPDHARGLRNLGFALTNAGRPQEALAHFREALRLQPGMAETHNHFGLALYRLGRWTGAAEQFQAALAADADFVQAHNNLGLTLNQLKRYSEAIAHFRKAIGLAPQQPATHNNLGIALALDGEPAEAARAFRAALERRPDFSRAHANLARVLAELRDRDGAIAHYREALRLRPDLAEARAELEQLLRGQPDAPPPKDE